MAAEASLRVATISKQRDQDIETKVKAAGVKVNELSKEERKRWAEKLIDLPKRSASELDAKGLPATDVLKTYVRFLKEAGYEFPVDYPL